ncbi:MAG: HNH endonuclease [Deltaproteobacteria bacterium]
MKMKKSKSNIPFDYVTVKTTKSRISYGFLTIPVSLIDVFPKKETDISLINDLGKEEIKHFTPYSSRSRECRIYGLRKFFRRYKMRDGDEIVIQLLDDKKYRLIPEKVFEKQILDLEIKIEKNIDEKETNNLFQNLSKLTNKTTDEVIKNEFVRLSSQEITERKIKIKPEAKTTENVPLLLRKILLELYKGKCQVSGFTFLMKNSSPYFEIHHIDSSKGNHFKNLLVVSPNVHKQFTYANLEQFFDKEGWLRKVKFNEDIHSVFQVIDKLPKSFEREIHY